MPENKSDWIKTADYAFEQSKRNSVDIVALKEISETLKVVVRDLTWIVKELCEHDTEIADETYGSALEGHLASLDGGDQSGS